MGKPAAGDMVLGGVMVVTLAVFAAMAPLGFSTGLFCLPPAIYFSVPLCGVFLGALAAARRAGPDETPRVCFRRVMTPRLAAWAILWGVYFAALKFVSLLAGDGMAFLGIMACLAVLSWMTAFCLVFAPGFRRLALFVPCAMVVGPAGIALIWCLAFMVLSSLAQAKMWDPGYMGMGLAFLPPMAALGGALLAAPCAWGWTRWRRGDAWFGAREAAEPGEAPEAAAVPDGGEEEAARTAAVRRKKLHRALAAAGGFVFCYLAGIWLFSWNSGVTRLEVIGGRENVTGVAARDNLACALTHNGFELEIREAAPGSGGTRELSKTRLRDCGSDVAVSGDLACVSDGAGITVLDVSDPASPRVTASLRLPGRPPCAVAVSGALAFTINWEVRWGSDSPRRDGKPNADIVEHQVCVVDVSNPSAPALLGTVTNKYEALPGMALSSTGGSDLAVAGSLLLCACGQAGMVVVDVSNPSTPVVAGVHRDGDRHVRGVAARGTTAFAATGADGDGACLQVVGLDDPAHPVLLSSLDLPGAARDVSVAGGLAHVAAGPSGVRIVDVSDPHAPRACGSYRPVMHGNLTIDFFKVAASGTLVAAANRFNPKSALHIFRPPPGGETPGGGEKQAGTPPPRPPTPPENRPAARPVLRDIFGGEVDEFAREVIDKRGIAGRVVMGDRPVADAKVAMRLVSRNIADGGPDCTTVAAEAPGGQEWTATTDGEGRFAFYGLEAGHYGLEAWTDDAWGVDDMPVRAGSIPGVNPRGPDYYAARSQMSIGLWPMEPLQGRVLAEDGSPVAGATVFPVRGQSQGEPVSLDSIPSVLLRAQTDGNGEFRCPRLAAGQWQFMVRAGGYPNQRTGWMPTGGQHAEIRLGRGESAAQTPDGAAFKLSDYRGKYVLLDFWAVWCAPCREEVPNVRAVYEEYKDDPRLVLIGMDMDPNPGDAKRYAAENGMEWRQYALGDWSKTAIPAQYKVTGIPCMILLDPEGRELARDMRGPMIKTVLRNFLGEPKGAGAAAEPFGEARRMPGVIAATPSPANDGTPGTLVLNIDRDFEYVPEGFPLGISVGQTDAPKLSRDPVEFIVAEPMRHTWEVRYGYLQLGNGEDNRYSFMVDDLDKGTWIGYFDRNNNEDLTDDGPPVIISDLVEFDVDIVLASGETVRRPYKIWQWGNTDTGAPGLRFYTRCHHKAEVEINGERMAAIAFEQFNHDALYKDDGIWLDMNRDNTLDEKTELFKDGSTVTVKGKAFTVKLDYP